MSKLIHLNYASRITSDISEDEILDILSAARKNNKANDVSGMLLYENGSFLQILEGEEETVNDLFEHISKDDRHNSIVKIISEAIAQRDFSDWSMGFANISLKKLEKLEGLNDFFVSGNCLADLDAGRAKKVLEAFSKGRWRLC